MISDLKDFQDTSLCIAQQAGFPMTSQPRRRFHRHSRSLSPANNSQQSQPQPQYNRHIPKSSSHRKRPQNCGAKMRLLSPRSWLPHGKRLACNHQTISAMSLHAAVCPADPSQSDAKGRPSPVHGSTTPQKRAKTSKCSAK